MLTAKTRQKNLRRTAKKAQRGSSCNMSLQTTPKTRKKNTRRTSTSILSKDFLYLTRTQLIRKANY